MFKKIISCKNKPSSPSGVLSLQYYHMVRLKPVLHNFPINNSNSEGNKLYTLELWTQILKKKKIPQSTAVYVILSEFKILSLSCSFIYSI